MDQRDAMLFLRALKEEGVGELYWKAPPKTGTPAAQPERFLNSAPVLKPAVKPAALPAEQPPVSAAVRGKAPAAVSDADPVRAAMLDVFKAAQKCTLCPELCSTRNKVVFGSGNIHAKLVFVGEAPGRDEDEQGLPFVGRAGQLLTRIIEAMGYSRKDVFICNTLKCRPPQNRQPKPEELINCQPFLKKQLELIRPKIICALGTFAAQTLLQTEDPISRLRGKFHTYEGIPLMCTYHPAYLLRNPAEKVKVWEDMKLVKQELERP